MHEYKEIDIGKYITVGKEINIKHISMAREGEDIQIIATIVKRGKREVFFEVKGILNHTTIATASHLRMIVPKKLIYKILQS